MNRDFKKYQIGQKAISMTNSCFKECKIYSDFEVESINKEDQVCFENCIKTLLESSTV